MAAPVPSAPSRVGPAWCDASLGPDAVVLKLIVADLWLVGPLYRTIAFTGLGVVLLGSSLRYHRFRDIVVGDGGEV
jgi:hypothetical protein